MKVGFVGLGNQGAPMARMIDRGGFELYLWARRAASLEPFADTGATAVERLADLGERCDLIGVCVVDDRDVAQVALEPDGLLATMRPDAILVIHSTVHPETCKRVAERAGQVGVHVLDAPVSGSGQAALSQTLSVLAGGEDAVFARARPVLECYGNPISHLGPLGSGQLAKLLNNVAFYANLRVAATVLTVADEFGMERKALIEVMKASSGRSMGLDTAAGDLSSSMVDHILTMGRKDLELAGDIVAPGSALATLAAESKKGLLAALVARNE